MLFAMRNVCVPTLVLSCALLSAVAVQSSAPAGQGDVWLGPLVNMSRGLMPYTNTTTPSLVPFQGRLAWAYNAFYNTMIGFSDLEGSFLHSTMRGAVDAKYWSGCSPTLAVMTDSATGNETLVLLLVSTDRRQLLIAQYNPSHPSWLASFEVTETDIVNVGGNVAAAWQPAVQGRHARLVFVYGAVDSRVNGSDEFDNVARDGWVGTAILDNGRLSWTTPLPIQTADSRHPSWEGASEVIVFGGGAKPPPPGHKGSCGATVALFNNPAAGSIALVQGSDGQVLLWTTRAPELAGSWDYSPLNPLPNAAGDNLLIRNATSAAVVAADYPAHAGGAAEGAAADRLAVFYPRYDGLGFGYSVVTLSSSPTAPLQVNLSQSIRPDLELTQQQLAAASFGKELSLLYFDIDDLRVKQLLHGPHTTISRSALGVAAEPR